MTMTYERFEHLADAYGGDLRRWPEVEREAGRALLESDPRAAVLLREADGLDALLDAAPRPVATHALREQVIASAAGAGLKARRRGPGPLAWLSGAGWAAAACAGVVFGITLTSHLTADVQADAVLYQASLTSADDTEVLGG
jgi:anti-sigma factor RsiW